MQVTLDTDTALHIVKGDLASLVAEASPQEKAVSAGPTI